VTHLLYMLACALQYRWTGYGLRYIRYALVTYWKGIINRGWCRLVGAPVKSRVVVVNRRAGCCPAAGVTMHKCTANSANHSIKYELHL
jgi:hypothetical protein